MKSSLFLLRLMVLVIVVSSLNVRGTMAFVIDPTIPPVLMKELVITVNGGGRVESNPGNFICEAGDTCKGYFFPDSVVALHAVPESGETFTASFGEWSGDCGGYVPACAVYMDSDKHVTVQFTALGIPPIIFMKPNAKTSIPYHATDEPAVSFWGPEDSKPVGVGHYAEGFSLLVNLPPFFEPVDMYLGLTIPGHDDIYYFNSDNYLVSQASGVVLWKGGVSDAINETVLNKVPVDFPLFPFPRGLYLIHLIVTPAGNLDHYYHWRTAFVVHNTVFPIQ